MGEPDVERSLPPLLAAHRGPFVGRGGPLEVLRGCWARARDGGAELVLVSGPAGTGKTRLARELALTVLADGGAVLAGRCDPDGDPQQPWPEAVGAAEPAAALERASASGPVLLVLDDLHWAGAASLRALRTALRRCAGAPLLVLGTHRDDEHPEHVAQALADLRRDRVVERLALGGLAVEDVAALVEHEGLHERTGAAPLTIARRVHRRSGGHPLLTAELVRHLRDGGSEDDLPAGIRDVVGVRWARLPDEVRAVLAGAAVLGRRVEPRTLAALVEVPEQEVLAALDAGVRGGLVEEERGTPAFRFTHALVRDAVHDAVPGAERRALHGRAVGVLEAAGAPATVLAVHARTAGADRDAAVRWTLEAAAEAARARAAEEAVDHLLAARALLEAAGDEPALARVLVALGDMTYSSGVRYADGIRHLEDAVALHERLGDVVAAARARSRLGRALSTYFDEMDLPAALRHLTAAQAVLRDAGDLRGLGAALAGEANARYWSWELRRGLQAAEEAEELAAHGSASALPVAQALRGRLLCHLGRLDEGEALLDRAWAAAEEQGLLDVGYFVTVFACSVARRRFDLAAAEDVLRRGLALPGLDEAPRAWEQLHLFLVSTLIARGDVAAAEELLPRTGINRSGLTDVELPLALGDWEHAFSTSSVFFRLNRSGRHQYPIVFPALLDQQPELLRYLEGEAERAHEDVLVAATTRLAVALGLVPLGRVAEARAHVDAVRASLAPGQDWGALPHVLALVEAEVATGDGDGVRALALADRARQGLAACGALWLEAEALLAAARATAGSDPATAAARVEAALALYRRAGAGARWEERARAVLQAPAAVRGPAGVFRRSGEVWTVGLGGAAVAVRDSKGMRVLHVLLGTPGREVPARELEALLAGGGVVEGDTGPLLDDAAKAAYRRRLAQLEQDLAAADVAGDPGRAEVLEQERRALLAELRRAVGLGGRDRRTGSPDERARLNVTRAVRSAIRRIAAAAPDAGRHLDDAVVTGTACAYRPQVPVRWER